MEVQAQTPIQNDLPVLVLDPHIITAIACLAIAFVILGFLALIIYAEDNA